VLFSIPKRVLTPDDRCATLPPTGRASRPELRPVSAGLVSKRRSRSSSHMRSRVATMNEETCAGLAEEPAAGPAPRADVPADRSAGWPPDAGVTGWRSFRRPEVEWWGDEADCDKRGGPVASSPRSFAAVAGWEGLSWRCWRRWLAGTGPVWPPNWARRLTGIVGC